MCHNKSTALQTAGWGTPYTHQRGSSSEQLMKSNKPRTSARRPRWAPSAHFYLARGPQASHLHPSTLPFVDNRDNPSISQGYWDNYKSKDTWKVRANRNPWTNIRVNPPFLFSFWLLKQTYQYKKWGGLLRRWKSKILVSISKNLRDPLQRTLALHLPAAYHALLTFHKKAGKRSASLSLIIPHSHLFFLKWKAP